MSEHQIVKFRAIDRPLTTKQLEFMERQSSRAEFSEWAYEVEYHYSEFRGNVDAMLQNGYDIFLNYANYGVREIRLRLAHGLPFPEALWSKYIGDEGLTWTPDKTGKGGILSVAPFNEEAYEDEWEFDAYLKAATKLRDLLIVGDQRALYVLWLCRATDDNSDVETLMEPPVPHGLLNFPEEAKNLLSFFLIDPLLVDAAAIGIPTFDSQTSRTDSVTSWLSSITESRRTEIIQRLLSEDPVGLKCELLAEIRDSQKAIQWPVESSSRTVRNLLDKSDELRQKEDEKERREAAGKAKREADKAEKQRQARMVEMKTAPEPWLEKASVLVNARGTENYSEAASILADLREAIGGDQGKNIARTHAAHLVKKHPTLTKLKYSLRMRQLLD